MDEPVIKKPRQIHKEAIHKGFPIPESRIEEAKRDLYMYHTVWMEGGIPNPFFQSSEFAKFIKRKYRRTVEELQKELP